MFIKNIRRIILIFFLFLIITIYIFIKNKNDFHIYYTLRSFVTSDSEYNNLLKINYLVQEDSKIYNTHNKDFSINWSFRPEHFHPIYPKLIVKDIDKDGIKEIYLASQTKKIYELNSLNGKVKRTWSFPQGQSSSKGTLMYEKGNKNFLLTTSTISLPIKVYSLDLNKKNIEVDWKANLHGQFVESGINIKNDNIIIATRDAPYSRGSLYIFNKFGKIIFGPEKKIDICNSRPIIEGDFFVHGSHNFYNAEHGNSILKRNINNGHIIWKNEINFDTGFITSNLINFDDDNYTDVIVYNIKYKDMRKSVILNGKNGKKIFERDGIVIDKTNGNHYIIETIDSLLKTKDELKKIVTLLEKNNFFEHKLIKLIEYLEVNNEMKNLNKYYLGFLSSFYNIDNLFLKNLLITKDVLKKNSDDIPNKIQFFDSNYKSIGENYFILTSKDLTDFEFHTFYVYKNNLLYLVYDKNGNLNKFKIIDLLFDAFKNDFIDNFYKNSKDQHFPNITIAKISDIDNDNKLEIILIIDDYLVSLNLDVKNKINYDTFSFPNSHNDNLIFYN